MLIDYRDDDAAENRAAGFPSENHVLPNGIPIFTLRNDLRSSFDPGRVQGRSLSCKLHFAAVTKSDYMRLSANIPNVSLRNHFSTNEYQQRANILVFKQKFSGRTNPTPSRTLLVEKSEQGRSR